MTRTTPPQTRRHRSLTDDERTLWHSVAKTTTPLKRGRRKSLEPKVEVAKPETPSARPTPVTAATHSKPVKKPAGRPAEPPALAPLSRREKARLSRGRDEIDARIDLHGMTQSRAHRALLAFLQHAHNSGGTFVLVITGKGRGGGEQGVLRRQVPLWLALPEFRALVVGYEQAHFTHGGEGALYVRVRRAR